MSRASAAREQSTVHGADRYSRQELLPFIGAEGQARLRASGAMIVGLGALGCPVADALARAGVGRLTIIDRDVVDLTNLHRQTLYTEADADAALPKAEAARARLHAVNREVAVTALCTDVSALNAARLHADARADVIVDCTDNYEARYLLNDLAVSRGATLVYGGAVGAEGMAMTIVPGRTPCLRCVFPEPPPLGERRTCDTSGALGPATMLVGALQAGAAMRALLGMPPAPWLTRVDLASGLATQADLAGARDPSCPCCALRRLEWLEGARGAATSALCGRGAVQVSPGADAGSVDLDAVAERLSRVAAVSRSAFFVRAATAEPGDAGPVRITVFGDGRAIFEPMSDEARARALYARYVGA